MVDLQNKQTLLQNKFDKYLDLSEQIGEMLEEDADFTADRDIVDQEEVKYSKKLLVLKNFITKHSKKPEARVKDSDSVTTESKRVRVSSSKGSAVNPQIMKVLNNLLRRR